MAQPGSITSPILAVDAAYAEDAAAAAGVYLADWDADRALETFALRLDGPPKPYAPGEFYKRELPVLTALIAQAPLPISEIVIDGYVWLSGEGAPGLGARLYEALERKIPVIGVAKTKFGADDWSQAVLRGGSRTPLYVTSAGVDAREAAEHVRRMSGVHRIPTLLRHVDELARATLVQSA